MAFVRLLGHRYLWVDALYIIQDDLADKAKQLPMMGMIYGSSTFTIMAAAGDSAEAGLPV
jgi:hypothetical protein